MDARAPITRSRGRHVRENVNALVYLLPALVIIGFFMAFPLVYSAYLSFFDWDGLSAKVFRGLGNYAAIIRDAFFWRSLENNLVISVVAVVAQVFLGFVIAYCLVRVLLRGKRGYLFFYVIPLVVSEICIGLLWSFVYNPYFGLLNGLLHTLGLGGLAKGWLGDPSTAFPSVINAMNWTYLGLYILLFVNSIQNVPETTFDAAQIDGAGHFRSFFSIVIPMTWDSISSTALLCVVSAFKTFSLVLVLTNGGPSHVSEVLSTYLYKIGFGTFQMGYAATIGTVQMVLTAAVGAVVLRMMARSKSAGAYTS